MLVEWSTRLFPENKIYETFFTATERKISELQKLDYQQMSSCLNSKMS